MKHVICTIAMAVYILIFFSVSSASGYCCCVDDVQVNLQSGFIGFDGAAHVDEELGWGHKFNVVVSQIYYGGEEGGACQLRWFEKTNYVVPSLRSLGITPGEWQDHYQLNAASPMWQAWNASAQQPRLGAQQVIVTDMPAIPFQNKRLVAGEDRWQYVAIDRTLVIDVEITSTCASCALHVKHTQIQQYLTAVNGQPGQASIAVREDPPPDRSSTTQRPRLAIVQDARPTAR